MVYPKAFFGAKRDIIVLLILSGIILFWNLGSGSLTSWDEGVYAQVAKEMYLSGNWIDLTWRGEPWSDKPPFYMWLTVLFYKLSGVNEFSARAPSAIFGTGTVLLVYALASSLYCRKIAFASSLLLLSTWHFIWSAKMGMLDATFSFFIALSLLFLKFGENKKLYLFLFWLSFTLAFLTKGVGALLIPTIVLAYLFSVKKMALLRQPSFIAGAICSFILLAFWHYFAFLHYRGDFISGYFTKHLFIRTTQTVEGHVGGVFSYFKVLPNKGRPWGAFFLLAVPIIFWRVVFKKEKEHILPLTWAICVFLVATLVKTKLHWYIIAIYPAASLLVAWLLSRVFKKRTIIAVALLALSSLIYLSLEKKIFDLDYSHDSKYIAGKIRAALPNKEKIYSYNIIDPAFHFYCSDLEINISDKGLPEVLQKKDSYILFEKKVFSTFDKSKFTVIAENHSFVAAKTR
ncbi:MAG: glycosyltransferase family 39 protein [Candidatus Omnitrophica bacterium]|nr:glycosyltransferase family 39 protein [Candidatus Omnitrophota bacterium]